MNTEDNQNFAEINEIDESNPINYKITSNYPKFKYSCELKNIENTSGKGINDIFEPFISLLNKKSMIATKNQNKIIIYSLEQNEENQIIHENKFHEANLLMIRHFSNNKDKDKLISSDEKGIVIIIDIMNNFNKEYKIEEKIRTSIFSCLLIYDISENENQNDYCVTSFESKWNLYSLNSNNKIGKRNNSFSTYEGENIKYLLYWYNSSDEQHYLIQLREGFIIIENLFFKKNDEIYLLKQTEGKTAHMGGFLYKKNNKDFLVFSAFNGYIEEIDLETKQTVKAFKIPRTHLSTILPFDEKYVIVADYSKNNFIIVDIEIQKCVIYKREVPGDSTVCIKRFECPSLGDCLLCCGVNNKIYVWVREN